MAGKPFVPPGRAEADRLSAFALDLIDYMAAGDRPSAAALIKRLHDDPTIDPWALVMGVAAWAVTRPCGRAHPADC